MRYLVFVLLIVLLAGCSMRLPWGRDVTTGDGKPVSPATEEAVTQVFLHRAGLGFFIGGTLAVISGIILSKYLGTIGDYLRSGGLAALVAGAIFLFVAAYVKALYWSVGLVLAGCIACGVLWIIAHRKDLVPYFGKAAVKGGK